MLCSSIKLTDRREYKQDKTPKRNRSTMLEERLFMKSDYYHSYTFRWDKPRNRHYYSPDNSQFLTIQDIIFPEDLSKLNDPPPKDWLKRKPRPNTTDTLPNFNANFHNEDDLSISALTEPFSQDAQGSFEEIKPDQIFDGEDDDLEIDPHVHQLILSKRESEKLHQGEQKAIEEDAKSERKRKKQKKKSKTEHGDDKKEKKTKTKTVKYYLSKPPTPQTLEVIRVDVISNFSMQEELPDTNRTESSISDCSKGCGRKILKDKEIKEKIHREMVKAMELSENDVNVMCRRLCLKDRNECTVLNA